MPRPPGAKEPQLLILLPALVGGLIMIAWMARPIVTGQIPLTGDLLHWNYPIRDFFAGAVTSGQTPFWMPSILAGFDVAGEGQLGAFHPVHWLLYRFVPLDRAFALELVLPYLVAFTGMWVFLRRRVPSGQAAFGAMLFAFCGFMLSHGVHMNMVAIVAHMPWMLWACDRAFDAPSWSARRRVCAVIALLTGSQVLLGHPPAAWWSALVTAAFAAFLVT